MGRGGARLGRPSAPPSRQAKKERKRAILADASQIYATDVESEIRARAQVFRDTWEAREPQAVAAFFHDFAQTLCYLTVHFPRAYVSLIRTTNLLERFHKEIRRKQRDIGMLQSDGRRRRAVVYGGHARNRQTAGLVSRQGLRIREEGHTLPGRSVWMISIAPSGARHSGVAPSWCSTRMGAMVSTIPICI